MRAGLKIIVRLLAAIGHRVLTVLRTLTLLGVRVPLHELALVHGVALALQRALARLLVRRHLVEVRLDGVLVWYLHVCVRSVPRLPIWQLLLQWLLLIVVMIIIIPTSYDDRMVLSAGS